MKIKSGQKALAFVILGCLVTHSESRAQERTQLEQQKLNIEWPAETKSISDSLQFSVSLYFDSDHASADRNKINVVTSSGDEKADIQKIDAVIQVINKAIFDVEKPLGLPAFRGKDIYFSADCKLIVIDESSQLLVVDVKKLGRSTAHVHGKPGVFLIENGNLSSVVRVPGEFIFDN